MAFIPVNLLPLIYPLLLETFQYILMILEDLFEAKPMKMWAPIEPITAYKNNKFLNVGQWSINIPKQQRVAEIKILQLICDHIKINECIRNKMEVAFIEDKMMKTDFGWFKHTNALVRKQEWMEDYEEREQIGHDHKV